MKETKIVHQRARKIQEVDQQDAETLARLQNEPKVEIYMHRDEENDEPIVNKDGSISYVRTVNINGVQWQIPVEVKCQIPKSIYEILQRTEYLKSVYKPKPINLQRINLGQDHLFIK